MTGQQNPVRHTGYLHLSKNLVASLNAKQSIAILNFRTYRHEKILQGVVTSKS